MNTTVRPIFLLNCIPDYFLYVFFLQGVFIYVTTGKLLSGPAGEQEEVRCQQLEEEPLVIAGTNWRDWDLGPVAGRSVCVCVCVSARKLLC